MEIGFIGLGNMGAPMAKNLAAAGHQITGFDLDPTHAAAMQGAITVAASLADAAQGRDVVITMLQSEPRQNLRGRCRARARRVL